jgi:hypothetical protein
MKTKKAASGFAAAVSAYTGAWSVVADTAAGVNTATYGTDHKRIMIADTP